ncbi:MAG: hypothetical protein Q7N87_01445 [Candidatus Uhrbacteria bacterium]|nr:hypothetical protein [Candidatus Uhrbacteria bacterium]
MRIQQICFVDESGYISMTDGRRFFMFFPFGKDEVRRILEENAKDAENVPLILSGLEQQVDIPEIADRQTTVLEGKTVIALNQMMASFGPISGAQLAAFSRVCPEIHNLLFSDDPSIREALIGFSDERGSQHIVVFYSRQQIKHFVWGMDWLTAGQRQGILRRVYSSHLPKRTSQPMVKIVGPIAGLFNCAAALQRQSASRN